MAMDQEEAVSRRCEDEPIITNEGVRGTGQVHRSDIYAEKSADVPCVAQFIGRIE